MSDPRAFALARLAEEEAQAKAEHHYDPDEGGYYACPVAQIAMFGRPADEESDGACTCGLEQRRERALMRVAALRALVELHEPWPMGVCGGCSDREIMRGREYEHGPIRAEGRWRPYPCRNVRHVAAIWAWHEDYDESWKL